MEVLREINEEEMNFIETKLQKHLPYTIKDLHFIFSAKQTKKLAENYSNISAKILPKFYVPENGIKENCTVFAVTEQYDHTVWFFTLQESLDEVKECLKMTKLINWNKVLFVAVHREHVKSIIECVERNDYKMLGSFPSFYYSLTLKEAKQFVIE